MKPKIPRFVIPMIILLLIGGGGYWVYTSNPALLPQTLTKLGLTLNANAETDLTASGFMEADEVTISAEIGGRIIQLGADKSDAVSAGQTLVQLDTSLIDAQTEQTTAQIELAQAQLAKIEAGVPAEQIAVAETAVTLAETNRDAAYQTWQDAITSRDNPQQLNAEIDAAARQVELMSLQTDQTAVIRDAVELRESIAAEFWDLSQRGIDFSVTIPTPQGIFHKSGHRDFPEGEKQQASESWNLATMDVWQAWVNWETAKSAHTAAQSTLYTLQTLKNNPLQANLQITQAEAAFSTKVAAIPVARANLNQIKAGASPSQIGILQAQLQQAQSQLVRLQTQRDKYTLVSPMDGVVVQRLVFAGELASPGMALLTVANLDRVTLTVYVSAADYGRLKVGQQVQVFVDTYPNRTFNGTITFINSEAEFTPKNVQTREERVSLVYAIKITLPNPDGTLKPGMPADVTFVEAMSAQTAQ